MEAHCTVVWISVGKPDKQSIVKQVCDPETPWILLGPDFLFRYSHLALLSSVL